MAPEQVSNDFRSSLDDALEVARGDSRNLWTALHWAARLPEAQGAILASEALSRFATISDEWERELALAKLIPALSPDRLNEALDVARNLRQPQHMAKSLAAIAARASAGSRQGKRDPAVVAGAIVALCAMEWDLMRNPALSDVRRGLEAARNSDVAALCLKAADANGENIESARILAFVSVFLSTRLGGARSRAHLKSFASSAFRPRWRAPAIRL